MVKIENRLVATLIAPSSNWRLQGAVFANGRAYLFTVLAGDSG